MILIPLILVAALIPELVPLLLALIPLLLLGALGFAIRFIFSLLVG